MFSSFWQAQLSFLMLINSKLLSIADMFPDSNLNPIAWLTSRMEYASTYVCLLKFLKDSC